MAKSDKTSAAGKAAGDAAKLLVGHSPFVAIGHRIAGVWRDHPRTTGIAIGLAVGAIGVVCVLNYNPPDNTQVVASTVFDRIVAQNEMVSASQKYMDVQKNGDSNSFFGLFDIPFTGNSFWYRYVGTLKAGVNLQTAKYELDGTTIHITLDQPHIISDTPDRDQSGVLEEKNNVLNPIHVEDVDKVLRDFQQKSEEQAVEGGLLNEAKENAEKNLTCMFQAALGDTYTVTFTYRGGGQEDAS